MNQKSTTAKRKGATKKSTVGRKPAADPKKQLSIYVETSIIEANGGKEEAQVKMYDYLKDESRKKSEAKSVEE